MPEPNGSIWQTMQDRGYSRRDFMQFCTYAAGLAGLGAHAAPAVAKAFEKKARPPVVWLHFQECTCCSESFIRCSHPIVADVLLDAISLDYSETLQAASGHAAEKCLHDTMKNHAGKYILLVEGSVPTEDGGIHCCIGGRTALDILKEAAAGAAAVISWGNCAAYGCVQAAKPNPTGATPIGKLLGKPVINVPGCPPIADVMVGVVTHILMFGRPPELDNEGRPKEFYARRVHDTCYRRPFYDAGMFVEAFDDNHAREGHCLYHMGCRGPVTYNACSVTKWNEHVSYPIQSGHGCLGCSENGFWDNGPFYKHLPGFPGFGIESTADKIGLAVGAAAAVGVAAHALTTNLRKRSLIQEHVAESASEPEQKA
jgi:hydrogenase small subunit